MTKIVIISDTHGYHEGVNVPDGDILIHCGDHSLNGETWELNNFLKWFGAQKPVHKVFINGNHEVQIYKAKSTRDIVDSYNRQYMNTIRYLEDNGVEIEGLKLWGSPYTPEFFDWAYMYTRKHGEIMWQDVPDDTDILITHGPPAGILDKVMPLGDRYPRENAGCDFLLERVKEIKPMIHCFGHIHSGYGVVEEDETLFINGASCNEQYVPVNLPIVVTLDV